LFEQNYQFFSKLALNYQLSFLYSNHKWLVRDTPLGACLAQAANLANDLEQLYLFFVKPQICNTRKYLKGQDACTGNVQTPYRHSALRVEEA
jgi:hypothetical protein